jgi:hypothetical protein
MDDDELKLRLSHRAEQRHSSRHYYYVQYYCSDVTRVTTKHEATPTLLPDKRAAVSSKAMLASASITNGFCRSCHKATKTNAHTKRAKAG